MLEDIATWALILPLSPCCALDLLLSQGDGYDSE